MSRFTHLDEAGAARMVDVSAKQVTVREAVAEGQITMSREAANAIRNQSAAKGDVLAVARIAGIMAAKRSEEHTSELQSLMRISYAAFCLKKKHKQKNITK